MNKLNSTLAEQASNNNGPKGAKAKEIFLGIDAHLADGAHSLTLDPTTHHSYIPISKDHNGSPMLREYEPT